jgi:hypothetical protein
MSGIGRFKLSDAVGKDADQSKAAKGGGKGKKGIKPTALGAPIRGQAAEPGRSNLPAGHQKVGGGGRGA